MYKVNLILSDKKSITYDYSDYDQAVKQYKDQLIDVADHCSLISYQSLTYVVKLIDTDDTILRQTKLQTKKKKEG